MEKYPKQKKIFLTTSVIISLGALIVFKYSDFMIANFNGVFGTKIALLNLALPIGISFYTFQVLSYIIDIYNGKVAAQRSLIKLATYVSLFPQLIAGPIVRYTDVEKELTKREHTFEKFSLGIRRFIIGLSKKVLIANSLGELCQIFLATDEKSIVFYWIYGIAFSLQIYFDFSAYSDMAIGLGLIFGFHFKENFNYPLTAKSITDFWRKWHISLSSWFKEYLYIPLGGSKKGTKKTIRNLFIVWITTGLWHGANWNFIIWGLYFGILLILEKFLLKKFLENHKFLDHISTLIMIIIGFIIFSIEAKEIIPFIKNMIGLNHLPFINFETIFYFKNYIILFLIAIIGSTPIVKKLYLKGKEKWKGIEMIEPILLGTLLIITTAFIIDESYNPFLYFRF